VRKKHGSLVRRPLQHGGAVNVVESFRLNILIGNNAKLVARSLYIKSKLAAASRENLSPGISPLKVTQGQRKLHVRLGTYVLPVIDPYIG